MEYSGIVEWHHYDRAGNFLRTSQTKFEGKIKHLHDLIYNDVSGNPRTCEDDDDEVVIPVIKMPLQRLS